MRIATLLLALILCLPARAEPAAPSAGWERTLERVVPAVVAIRIRTVRDFDTEKASYGWATGFVIDAEQGLILTNRHVVGPGTVVAEATFENHEEVEIRAIYRDPVHDFGLFRYDPADVKFMKPAELELRPDHARVGVEIRVVGNDAGEKLSILAGTLARLDRAAPRYGHRGYNDFNTFYIQAASSTSGGSSGSPVVDVHGHVVALNAGGRRGAASSFYLPLDRVKRAVDALRAGRPVPRGTLQTTWEYEPYHEVRRLGLAEKTEGEFRKTFPDGHGMLVARRISPEGPVHEKLQIGDVLVEVDGKKVGTFVGLESVLDARVGEAVRLTVDRSGERVTLTPTVQDLHAITPSELVEVGGSVVHALSYQRARQHGVPVEGVYVAGAGYMLRRAGIAPDVVIVAVDGEPVPTLDAFEKKVAALPDGKRVPFRFFPLADSRRERVAVVPIDRRWHSMQRCVRDDETGRWPCRPSVPPPPMEAPEPSTTGFSSPDDLRARALAPSLVSVEFDVPYRTDGVHGGRFVGTGVVVDAARGLVVVDRDTVAVAMGDVTLTFAGSVKVPGEVVFLHPVHGFSVVSYDPKALGKTPIRAARLLRRPVRSGQKVWLVGLTATHQVVSRESQVDRVDWMALGRSSPPRFRESNSEVISLTDTLPTTGGVLTDAKGSVLALWLSFYDGRKSKMRGLASDIVLDVLPALRAGKVPEVRSLGLELGQIPLADARARGLPEAQARRLERHDPQRRKVLTVERVTAGSPADGVFREGDLVVAAAGKPVTGFRDIERAERAESVKVGFVRDGELKTVDATTTVLESSGTDRALLWAGALVQAPHRAIASQYGHAPEGVYVSFWWFGSPAQRYGLQATRRIVEVDGRHIAGLDAFVEAVRGKGDRETLRLKARDLDGKEEVVTLLLDEVNFPAWELVREPEGWVRRSLDPPDR